jgi:hypothetical protein
LNIQTIPFSKFVTEVNKGNRVELEVNLDLRWLRRGFIVLIVVGGIFLFPIKVS